ncbi:MAG: MFS transporter [Alphaproteobacteria bacterium]|nr:MFS transporter [Alphaproteobacteria bacterium]
MPGQNADRAALKRNIVLAASLLYMVIGTGSVYFLVVALKPISAEFGWPRAVPSLAYSLQYFGGGIGGIFMGYMLDRRGMGIPAFCGASMIGIGGILTCFVSNEWELYFIYGVFTGFFGRAALFSPLMANITRWFDKKKSMAAGVVGSGQGLAGALWPPVFQHFNVEVGWRQTSLWYGVFVLVTMLPLVFVLRQRPPPAEPATPSASGGSVSRPEALPAPPPMAPRTMQISLSIAAIGCCVAMSLPLAHVVSHVSDLGYLPARGAEVLALMLACATASSFFGVGFLGGRYGGLRAIFIFSCAQALFLATLAFVDSLTALYVAAALFGIGYGGILPCYPVIVREHLPVREGGRRTAIVILFAGGGMAIGAWLGGAVFDLTGSYKLAFLIGVAFNLGNLAIIGRLILHTRVRPVLA